MARITDAEYLGQCELSSPKADKAAWNSPFLMFLVVRWIIKYIQDEVLQVCKLSYVVATFGWRYASKTICKAWESMRIDVALIHTCENDKAYPHSLWARFAYEFLSLQHTMVDWWEKPPPWCLWLGCSDRYWQVSEIPTLTRIQGHLFLSPLQTRRWTWAAAIEKFGNQTIMYKFTETWGLGT